MKLLSIMAIMLVSLSSYAIQTKTTIILDNKEKPRKSTNLEFKVDNSCLGRAWVTVDLVYDDFDDFDVVTVRTRVPGLVHNTDTREILLNGVVCATTRRVKKRRLFRKSKWVTKVNKTGNCPFKLKVLRKMTTIDEGFDVIKENRYHLQLTSRI